ncbi:hypothetical protein D3C76_542090 [compost metagenome]
MLVLPCSLVVPTRAGDTNLPAQGIVDVAAGPRLAQVVQCRIAAGISTQAAFATGKHIAQAIVAVAGDQRRCQPADHAGDVDFGDPDRRGDFLEQATELVVAVVPYLAILVGQADAITGGIVGVGLAEAGGINHAFKAPEDVISVTVAAVRSADQGRLQGIAGRGRQQRLQRRGIPRPLQRITIAQLLGEITRGVINTLADVAQRVHGKAQLPGLVMHVVGSARASIGSPRNTTGMVVLILGQQVQALRIDAFFDTPAKVVEHILGDPLGRAGDRAQADTDHIAGAVVVVTGAEFLPCGVDDTLLELALAVVAILGGAGGSGAGVFHHAHLSPCAIELVGGAQVQAIRIDALLHHPVCRVVGQARDHPTRVHALTQAPDHVIALDAGHLAEGIEGPGQLAITVVFILGNLAIAIGYLDGFAVTILPGADARTVRQSHDDAAIGVVIRVERGLAQGIDFFEHPAEGIVFTASGTVQRVTDHYAAPIVQVLGAADSPSRVDAADQPAVCVVAAAVSQIQATHIARLANLFAAQVIGEGSRQRPPRSDAADLPQQLAILVVLMAGDEALGVLVDQQQAPFVVREVAAPVVGGVADGRHQIIQGEELGASAQARQAAECQAVGQLRALDDIAEGVISGFTDFTKGIDHPGQAPGGVIV